VATFLVLIVVIRTKFIAGAWIVIAAMPVIIVGFYGVHRHYAGVSRQLRVWTAESTAVGQNTVVLFVEDLNAATARAVGYMRSFRGNDFHAVHVPSGAGSDIPQRWKAFCRSQVELELLPHGRHPASAVIEYVRGLPRGEQDFVTVVIPELLRKRSLLAAIRRGPTFLLKVRLLAEPRVVVTDVPVLEETLMGEGEMRPLIPERMEVLVFISRVTSASLRAINYARSLRIPETRAIFFALEASEIEEIQRDWAEAHIPLELDIVEAPFRDLSVPVLDEVRRVTSRPGAVAAVVVPELVLKEWWQNLLHNQRPLFIKRILLFEPRVILTSVPYRLS
jgi:hypothetical protein